MSLVDILLFQSPASPPVHCLVQVQAVSCQTNFQPIAFVAASAAFQARRLVCALESCTCFAEVSVRQR